MSDNRDAEGTPKRDAHNSHSGIPDKAESLTTTGAPAREALTQAEPPPAGHMPGPASRGNEPVAGEISDADRALMEARIEARTRGEAEEMPAGTYSRLLEDGKKGGAGHQLGGTRTDPRMTGRGKDEILGGRGGKGEGN